MENFKMQGCALMATSAVIDISTLSAPLPGASPVGMNLRLDSSPASIYYKIKDLRNQARAIERKQIEDVDAEQPLAEWQKLYQLAIELFSKSSKDIEIAAWLIEALLRLYNFAGLRDGLKFYRQLLELYWENLYPPIDEEGYQARLATFIGLNGEDTDGTLIFPITNVKLTLGKSVDSYSLWQYEQAHEVNQINDPEKRQKRIDAGAVKLPLVETSIEETPSSFFRDTAEELKACLDELQAIDLFFEEKCGENVLSLSRIKDKLKGCLDVVKIIGKSAFENSPCDQVNNQGNNQIEMSAVVSDKKILDREKAFAQILEVANFFEQNEPHSPLSYILRKAVRWGKTSLPELLAEIIHDDSALKESYKLTGIEKESRT